MQRFLYLYFIPFYSFIFNFLFCIGLQPINNVVRVSVEQKKDSAIHIHISILPQIPLSSRLPYNTDQICLWKIVGPCSLAILNIAEGIWPSQRLFKWIILIKTHAIHNFYNSTIELFYLIELVTSGMWLLNT